MRNKHNVHIAMVVFLVKEKKENDNSAPYAPVCEVEPNYHYFIVKNTARLKFQENKMDTLCIFN